MKTRMLVSCILSRPVSVRSLKRTLLTKLFFTKRIRAISLFGSANISLIWNNTLVTIFNKKVNDVAVIAGNSN